MVAATVTAIVIGAYTSKAISSVNSENAEATEEEIDQKEKKKGGSRKEWKPPRTEPNNLEEKLSMDEAKSIKGKKIMGEGEINDEKYKQGWTKRQHVHHPLDTKQKNTTIHWWDNNLTGETEGYKFV
jgi:hypothetical protein